MSPRAFPSKPSLFSGDFPFFVDLQITRHGVIRCEEKSFQVDSDCYFQGLMKKYQNYKDSTIHHRDVGDEVGTLTAVTLQKYETPKTTTLGTCWFR